MAIDEDVNSMANQEHPDLLKQSIARWNDRGATNPTIQPDLKRAELASCSFSIVSEGGERAS
jgi:hypothetical protein